MYCCAIGIVYFLPLAYAICQLLTVVLYQGRWRAWSLVPIPLVLAGLTALFWVTTPGEFTVVVLAASAVGMIALGCVWRCYTVSARAASEAQRDGEDLDDGGAAGA